MYLCTCRLSRVLEILLHLFIFTHQLQLVEVLQKQMRSSLNTLKFFPAAALIPIYLRVFQLHWRASLKYFIEIFPIWMDPSAQYRVSPLMGKK